MKKIFVTGGHYTPAAAVISELVRHGDWDIFYIGKKHSFEGDEALSYEYLELKSDPKIRFLDITTGRLQPRFTQNILQSISSLMKIPAGFCQSLYWIGKYQPTVILSFGGYIALPVVIVGWMLGIPVVTHEQTKVFGLANKIIQIFSSRICVSFRSTLPVDNTGRWFLTGNPLREETYLIKDTAATRNLRLLKKNLKLPVIYVTGGKQGSHAINEEILTNLKELVKNYLVIIQTGDNQQFGDFQRFVDAKNALDKDLQKRLLVAKFFPSNEIGAVFDLSDIVVSRSGANTVFDLAALGKPAILIPLPGSRHNEQLLNAQELAGLGLAEIVSQENLDLLLKKITAMAMNLKNYQKNAPKALDLIISDSAQKIAKIVSEETK